MEEAVGSLQTRVEAMGIDIASLKSQIFEQVEAFHQVPATTFLRVSNFYTSHHARIRLPSIKKRESTWMKPYASLSILCPSTTEQFPLPWPPSWKMPHSPGTPSFLSGKNCSRIQRLSLCVASEILLVRYSASWRKRENSSQYFIRNKFNRKQFTGFNMCEVIADVLHYICLLGITWNS